MRVKKEVDAADTKHAREVDESRKNAPFIQLADPDGIKALRMLYRDNKAAGDLFFFMTQHMDHTNCLIASMEVFAKALCKSRQTVSKSVKYLAINRYIQVRKTGPSNVYTLNCDIVWKSYGSAKAYAALQGTVLLSEDEQKPLFKTKKTNQIEMAW